MTEIEQAIKRIELGDNVGIVLQEYALNYHEQQVSKLPIQSVSKSFFCITEKETGKQTECKKQCSYCRCN